MLKFNLPWKFARSARRSAAAARAPNAVSSSGQTAAAPRGKRSLNRALRKLVTPRRGFILILVLGALSVLTVLGLSFTEQSRADLYGASNSRDMLATDGLAETGFQMALRILADDQNVWSVNSVGWNAAENGVGHTSRWGYNTNYNLLMDANYGAATPTQSGIMPDPGITPKDASGNPQPTTTFNYKVGHENSFLDSCETMLWNEEPLNNNFGYAYSFKFDGSGLTPSYSTTDPVTGKVTIVKTYDPGISQGIQRRPADPRLVLDSFLFQPLARVKKFRVRSGINYGVLQIALTPRDGAINVNGMFDPQTMSQHWGYHDYLWYDGSYNTYTSGQPYAGADRRGIEYILGRRPEYASMHAEYVSYDSGSNPPRVPANQIPGAASNNWVPNPAYDNFQFVANEPAGGVYNDSGVYDFRGINEPNGRNYTQAANFPADTKPNYPTYPSATSIGKLTLINSSEPVPFYGASWTTFSRYNMEAPRYPLWVSMQSPSMRADSTIMTTTGASKMGPWGGLLTPSLYAIASSFDTPRWWPTGRGWTDPQWSSSLLLGPCNMNSVGGAYVVPDFLFQGFGFDLNNPLRSGLNPTQKSLFVMDDRPSGFTVTNLHYNGAGMYGHPLAHSFQGHYVSSVALGRFWTDLMADWYFGGSPGYTNKLGKWPDENWLDNWCPIGSAYDSLGLGTQRMPPTSHIWMPGFFNQDGSVDNYEIKCGLQTSPRNMPPARQLATYVNPQYKFLDDLGPGGPHFQFSGSRDKIRAFGYQENFGPAGSGNPDNRMFDAININVAPYEVVYGLLTPEKIPSMLNRSIVAPHLHWKARYLDAAYDGMDLYARYTPTGDPRKTNPQFNGPAAAQNSWPDTPYMPLKDYVDIGHAPAPIGSATFPATACDTQAPAVLGTAIGVIAAAGSIDAPGQTTLPDGSTVQDSVAATPPKPLSNSVILGPPVVPSPVKGIPYRFGSIDYWGNFHELKINATILIDRTPANQTNLSEIDCTIAGVKTPFFRGMGPAPFNRSIHKQYEIVAAANKWADPTQGGWSPEKAYPSGTLDPNNAVGMVLNRMDFRTPEPLLYYRVEALDNMTSVGKPWNGWDTANAKFFTPWPDPSYSTAPYDFQVVPYKVGTGEPQDDVFVDCHYNLNLSPNSYVFPDKLDGTTNPSKFQSYMMCRPSFVTDMPDLFAQRICELPSSLIQLGSPYMPDHQPAHNPNNSVPLTGGTTAYSEGATFNGPTTGTKPAGQPNCLLRKNPFAQLHPYYGLPNPDYLLLYPEAPPSIHWCDQYRRYFPVATIIPPAATKVGGAAAGKSEYPDFVTAGGLGLTAMAKDPDVANLDTSTATKPWQSAPPPFYKLVDDVSNVNYPFIQPQICTPKGDCPLLKTPFVPGIDKDDAWRITRCGRKYQEIIADEIMDYQINPWWPNPVAHITELSVPLDSLTYLSDTRVIANITSKAPQYLNYMNTADANHQTMNSVFWASYALYSGQQSIDCQIPDYFAYYNRFWVRACQFYARGTPTAFGSRTGDYRVGFPYGLGYNNANEARGKYPAAFQYYGVWWNGYTAGNLNDYWVDNIRDFPENTVEDQIGCDFRYLVTAARPMYETPGGQTTPTGKVAMPAGQMAAATGRNHPFKSWADFVAMLGHLVYRSPLTVNNPTRGVTWTTTRPNRVLKGIRDRILGVNAWQVCHNAANGIDARNTNQFFDGSMIAAGAGSAAIPDALQGYYGYNAGGDSISNGAGGRSASQAIVAVDGFWPVSDNLGAFPDPSGAAKNSPEDMLYPAPPPGMFQDNIHVGGPVHMSPSDNKSMLADNYSAAIPDWEWKRRIDEWRGCDASGLRVEHQYISERAANDILVSLSNGQIGPIDFDGDGHITMTCATDIHNPAGAAGTPGGPSYERPVDPRFSSTGFWPSFPYHPPAGKPTVCEYIDYSGVSGLGANMNLGVLGAPSTHWKSLGNRDNIIDSCVTLPIKFRSNTFRVTVSVELTDKKYQSISASHRYQRVYSRATGTPTGTSKVQGPFTGEFILHGSRAMDGVDPDSSWLGADFGNE